MRVRISVATVLASLAIGSAVLPLAASDPPRRYIVILADEATTVGVLRGEGFRISRVHRAKVTERVSRLRARTGIRTDRVFRNVLPGFSARLTESDVLALRADPGVSAVVPDERLTLEGVAESGGGVAAVATTSLGKGAVVPTGIRRVRAHLSPVARIDGRDERVRGNVAVLDTGIAPHPDLVVAGGRNCTDGGGTSAYRDRNGHGTHVAGTIGAIDDGQGVVGVAPGVNLWAVKVMGDNGTGWVSWVICGLDWVASRKKADGSRLFDAVNMSISFPIDSRGRCGATSSPWEAASCRVMAMGIAVVGAAGNKTRDARHYRPGGYESVITVSALADFDGEPGGKGRQADVCPFYAADSDDTFANFSNFGPDVDLIAPGKCILSTFLNGRYAWMSGTSMATPHVAGAVVLYRNEHPEAGPLQILQALVHAGSFDWKTRTDPDGQPDPLLQVVTGPPPTFSIEVPDPVAWIGRDNGLQVPVSGGRSNGHWWPISLTVRDLPDGVSLLKSVIREKEGLLRLRSSGAVNDGDHVLKVRGSDGELRSTATLRLRIDARKPTGSFLTPVPGTSRVTSTVDQTLSWTEDDTGGSGLAKRDLRLQAGSVVKPGTCAGVTWQDAGEPIAGRSPQAATGVSAGLCHRWRLRLVDGARNDTTLTSGTLIVDTQPPPAPTFGAKGARSHQEGTNGPVWFGAATAGSLSLTVRSVDPHAGTRDLTLTAPDPTTGWSGPGAVTLDGASTTFMLSWARNAPSTRLRARATDRLDHRSPWSDLELLPDATVPVSAQWTMPAAGGTTVSGTSVRLEYGGGSDAGSGLDPVAAIQRQHGVVVNEGSCAGVAWKDHGPAERRASDTLVSDLVNGTCYRWILTSRDRVGNTGTSRTSGSVLVDAVPPTVAFSFPTGTGTLFHAQDSVDVTFTHTDRGGSGIGQAEVQRQVGRPDAPGSCASTTWKDDGPATMVTGAVTSLPQGGLGSGSCYRWQVTARDRAGNERVVRSARVLVDTVPPAAAEVSVMSGSAWADGPSGPVWFRGGASGSFVLGSRPPQDQASGIAGTRFGSLSPSAGWSSGSVEAAFVPGLPAVRTYAYGASATDASLRLTSRDRAGNDGLPVTIQLRADATPPSVTLAGPAGGTTILDDDRITLSWSDSDSGSGVASRVLQRQRARPDGAGACAAVSWSTDGSATSASSGMTVGDLKLGWCYRWRLTVRDRVGHTARAFTGAYRMSADIVLDVDTVRARLLGGTVSHSRAAPVRLTWVIDDVAGSGRLTSLVDRSLDGGTTWRRLANDLAGTRLAVRLEAGQPTLFAVGARDQAGNASPWEESDRLRLALLQENHTAVGWRGSWKRVKVTSALGGALKRSGAPGAKASLRVDGIGFALVTELGPKAGSVRLRIDGKAVATRSLRRPAGTLARQAVVVASFATPGKHTVEVVVKGDGRVAVDGFLVLRADPTPVQR